jgi:Biotin-requiring enzyme
MSSLIRASKQHNRQMAWHLAGANRTTIATKTPCYDLRRNFLAIVSSNNYWNNAPIVNASFLCSTTLLPMQLQHRLFHSTVMVPKDYPVHTLLPFPALSPTMEFGTIVKWEIQEGETFSAGSVLCTIETDKATMDFESQDDGILAKILKQGSNAVDLPIGSPIAVVVEDTADVAAFADFVLEDNNGTASPPLEVPKTTETSIVAAAATKPGVVGGGTGTSILLPSARFLAESK